VARLTARDKLNSYRTVRLALDCPARSSDVGGGMADDELNERLEDLRRRRADAVDVLSETLPVVGVAVRTGAAGSRM
jgi:hypothetical protein